MRTWKFDAQATEQRRLFSRILQVLDSQLVSIRTCAWEVNDDGVYITFVVSSEEDKAYRIKTLLYRLQDVRSVSVSIWHEAEQ